MQREMIPHRGSGLQEMYASILRRAKEVHRTDGDVLLWLGVRQDGAAGIVGVGGGHEDAGLGGPYADRVLPDAE